MPLRHQSALKIAGWTIFGPMVCATIAGAYTLHSFSGLAPEIVALGVTSTLVLALGLGAPLFLYFSMKLAELDDANRKLSIVAATDGLTDCLNRTAFATLVETRLGTTHYPGPLAGALLIIDADRFKMINDLYGHQNGDRALTLIARAIRTSVRAGDHVGRLGGEEFGVFLPGVDRSAAEAVAERLRHTVENVEFIVRGQRHPLSVSVGGIVFYRWATFQTLFLLADANLYAAKRAGRNTVRMDGFAEHHDVASPAQ